MEVTFKFDIPEDLAPSLLKAYRATVLSTNEIHGYRVPVPETLEEVTAVPIRLDSQISTDILSSVLSYINAQNVVDHREANIAKYKEAKL